MLKPTIPISLYPREGNSPSGPPRLPCERDFDVAAFLKAKAAEQAATEAGGSK